MHLFYLEKRYTHFLILTCRHQAQLYKMPYKNKILIVASQIAEIIVRL